MVTTIQVSEDLKNVLAKRRFKNKDTYEDVIWDLLEDTTELSEQTKKDIAVARKEIAEGKGIPLSVVKKELGL
jgi:vacuolar-type H+-ATPase subunit C/Vma6